MDWATEEAAKDLREARDAANATEKSVRDARLKDVYGLELHLHPVGSLDQPAQLRLCQRPLVRPEAQIQEQRPQRQHLGQHHLPGLQLHRPRQQRLPHPLRERQPRARARSSSNANSASLTWCPPILCVRAVSESTA